MHRINRKRKGLSTIVGAIFMIIVMAGAINVTLWTMQQQDRVTEAVVEKANSNLGKLNENVDITDIRVSNNKLNLTVSNDGGAAANIRSIYIVNETASPKEQYRYDLDLVVDGRSSVNIDEDSLSFPIVEDADYSVKVVTESGNAATSKITSLSKVALPMSLYIIPPTITPGENVTVLFTVTNNLTESELANAVTLNLSYSIECSPLGTETCNVTKHVEPSSNTTVIGKGNIALFKWVFEVKAPDETYITFNASLADAKLGNYVIEKGLVKVVDSAQTSFSSEIIVSSTLVQKPEIFLLLPNPFGESSGRGLWGVIVANPTSNVMNVSRIVVNLYMSKPTGGGGNEVVNTGCPTTPVYPASGWSCPHANMIEWKNIASPQKIGGLEALSFLARIEPDEVSEAEPAFMVSVAVFTNLGQFTKTGYSAGMDDVNLSVANVYLTDTTDSGEAIQDAHIFGNMSNIKPGVVKKLNVTVADFDTDADTHIDAGTKLVINVPRGFTSVTKLSWTGFNEPQIVPYTDGSTQIVATLSQDIGDTGAGEAKVLSFSVVPPIPEPAAQRIYIMHTLLDGTADSTDPGGATDFSVGSIAELTLQVDAS